MYNIDLKPKNNNVTLIRIILAISVIYYHSFGLLFNKKYDINFILSKQQSTTGGLAVHFFFIISGFFITKSFINSKDNSKYIQSRFLRIYPGLVFCIWVCGLIIGPLATKFSIKEYFSNQEFINFVFNNSYNFFNINYKLPGVFVENKFTDSVDGSLYTITYEIYYYIFIFIVGNLKLFSKRYFFVILFGIMLFLSYISDFNALYVTFCCFLSGVIGYLFFEDINWKNNKIFFIIIILFGITYWYGKYFYLIFPIFGTYFIFYLSFKKKIFKKFDKIGDLSYGLYIYSFPIQQLIINKCPGISSIKLFILSLIITLGIALFSWNFIEKPFLNKKNNNLLSNAKSC